MNNTFASNEYSQASVVVDTIKKRLALQQQIIVLLDTASNNSAQIITAPQLPFQPLPCMPKIEWDRDCAGKPLVPGDKCYITPICGSGETQPDLLVPGFPIPPPISKIPPIKPPAPIIVPPIPEPGIIPKQPAYGKCPIVRIPKPGICIKSCVMFRKLIEQIREALKGK